MAEWRWHCGEVNGRCPHCDAVLFRGRLLADFRVSAQAQWRIYHIECLTDFLIAFAPSPSPYAGWAPS